MALEKIIYLSFVCASVSFTVADTKLFEPMRKTFNEKIPFLGKLVSCGYCFGHWVSFALTAVYTPRLFTFWAPLDYFLTALVIAWFGGLQWALMSLILFKANK